MRGVEAVFQLLISVFTMALVVAIAFRVLGQTSSKHCEQVWDQDLSNLAAAISRAAISEPPTVSVVNLTLRCGESREHTFQIKEEEKALCARDCGEYMPSCYVIVHSVTDRTGNTIYSGSACIRSLSPYTYSLISSNGCPSDQNPFFSNPNLSTTIKGKLRLTLYIYRNSDSIAICEGKP